MIKKILSFVMLILLVSAMPFAQALEIEAPKEILIESQEEFFLVNISSIDAGKLEVNFYAPTEVQVSVSKYLTNNSKTTAKIYVRNEFENYQEINAKLEIYLNNELVEKNILLKFNPQKQENPTDLLTGLFILPEIEELTNFSIVEYGIVFLLILITAVLLIAFIARVIKRA